MQKFVLVLITCLMVSLSGIGQFTVQVQNPLAIARSELIAIPWEILTKKFPAVDTSKLQVMDQRTKKQLPYQLEYRGNEEPESLLVLVSIAAKSSILFRVQQGKPAVFSAKTYSRYVPERKDDFAWENDKIAFRMYGRALEQTPSEMAYGVDVWVKRTDKLVLNERYKRGVYHEDHGDGLDYYHVGLTLGAGGNAPFVNDSIWFPRNYSSWKQLDNGPLRSSFQLNYDDWMVNGEKTSMYRIISIDAGSQLSKVETHYSYSGAAYLPVAIGISKRNEPGVEYLNEKEGILAYWEPTDAVNGTTGVGCILEQPASTMRVDKTHLLAIVQAKPGQPVRYYSGAAWDRAGDITRPADWIRYLEAFRQKLQHPLVVQYNP